MHNVSSFSPPPPTHNTVLTYILFHFHSPPTAYPVVILYYYIAVRSRCTFKINLSNFYRCSVTHTRISANDVRPFSGCQGLAAAVTEQGLYSYTDTQDRGGTSAAIHDTNLVGYSSTRCTRLRYDGRKQQRPRLPGLERAPRRRASGRLLRRRVGVRHRRHGVRGQGSDREAAQVVSWPETHLPAHQAQAGQGHRVPFPGAVGKSGKEFLFSPDINTQHV